ncbi:MAG: CoA pyrophosphatase [Alphaproteobacteria bacterium]|nr:CoA pyrophosphatase [Alphaproteobacteria bacterium]
MPENAASHFDPDTFHRRLNAHPSEDERGDHDLNPGTRPDGALRPAAVLVGVVARDGGPTVLLTRRTDHLEHHPGQISFPGGHAEDGGGGAEATALREAREEIGLDGERARVLGRLSPYVTRTGFRVTPVVAALTPPLELTPDPHEVAEIFEVPLDHLMDPANHRLGTRRAGGAERTFYAIAYRDYDIWGATAGMIVDLHRALSAPPHETT